MSSITALILGHFVIGLLYGLRDVLNKEKTDETLKEYIARPDVDNRKKELAVKIIYNKPLILTFYSLIGYFHFYFSVKNLFKKTGGNK